jgi:hypothetical protein
LERTSQTIDAFAASLRHTQEGDVFPSPDDKTLRARPILVARDGRAIVADPGYFADKAAVGPLFIASEGRGRAANPLFDAFGRAFQDYVGALLRRMYPRSPGLIDRSHAQPRGRDRAGNVVELGDAHVVAGQDLIIFEAKATWLRADTLDRADDAYECHLDEKYAAPDSPASQPRGVTQLARAIAKLESGEWVADDDLSGITTVYPVLLTHDVAFRAPVHSHHLAQRFLEALAPGDVLASRALHYGRLWVTPLTVMTIDDLELLEASVESFALHDVLRAYAKASPDRLWSFYDFLCRSRYRRQIRRGRVPAEHARKVLGHISQLLSAH